MEAGRSLRLLQWAVSEGSGNEEGGWELRVGGWRWHRAMAENRLKWRL